VSFSNAVAIVGVGETDYSRASGRTELALSLQAIRAALDDAGIEPRDVDGLMKWWVDTSTEAEVAANLGIPDLAWWGEVNQAGNVGAPLVAHAAAAIHAGLANVVVIYRGVNGRSGRRYGRGDVTGQGGRGAGAFTEPHGLLTPQHGLAMVARRRMHDTGIASRHFGMQAVAQRRHANRNPRATFYGRTLSLEEHQASRLIVDPFHLFDCCLETDGGGALVLTSADRARQRGRAVPLIRAAAQAGPGIGSPAARGTPTARVARAARRSSVAETTVAPPRPEACRPPSTAATRSSSSPRRRRAPSSFHRRQTRRVRRRRLSCFRLWRSSRACGPRRPRFSSARIRRDGRRNP